MIRKVAIVAIQLACLVAAASVAVTYAITRSDRVTLRRPVSENSMFAEERNRIYVSAYDGYLKIGYRDKKRVDWKWSVSGGKPVRRTFMHFVYYRHQSRLRMFAFDSINLFVPLWFPFILFSAYPTVAFYRHPLRRWRWRRKGLCPKCGYNLTGNESGVCSECGSPIALDK